MKFGQLIEYSMKNISVEKSYTKYGGKLFPDPFLKHQSWIYLWMNKLKFCAVVIYLCMNKLKFCAVLFNWMLIWVLQNTLFYLLQSFFFKKKKRDLELASLLHFQHDFWRKIFLLSYSIKWPSFIAFLLLIRVTLSSFFIVIVC